MAITNCSIIPAANNDDDSVTPNGNFGTLSGGWSRFGGGYLPRKIAEAVHALEALGYRVDRTIYSYSTPIAFRIGDYWIVPDVTYSATTSTKHQIQLWELGARQRSIPRDISAAELRRIIDGKMHYIPGTRGKLGRYVPGPNYIPGE